MQLKEPIEALDPKTFPLHRYKPIEKLGHGESGRAFLCFDEFMEQDVVVKTMGEVELDKLIEFQRDATVLCRLRHKGLAQVLDFGCTASGSAYIVSEYYPGVSLSQYISASGPLPIDLALKTFVVISDALSQMHVHGILHRDIKTSNILVRNLDSNDCAIYLVDAGTGRVKLATMQPTIYDGRAIPGDPNYMSPEYASRLQYDSRSEIFSLGCTIFEALTGRTPFTGEESIGQLTRRSAPSLTQVSEGFSFPIRLEGFVAKCLSRSAETRYQSMPEVFQALKELVKLRLSIEPIDESIKTIRPGDTSARDRRGSNPQLKTAPAANGERNPDKFYEEENPVRLVNPEWMESSADESPELIGEEEKKPSNRRSRKPTLDSSSIAAPDESLAYFASSNIAFAKPEPKSRKRSLVAATTSASTASPASPAVAEPEEDFGPGFANAMRKLYKRMVNHHLSSEFSMVALAFWFLFISCSIPFFSYMSYLTAPSVDVRGTVFSYQPASAKSEGRIELADFDSLGTPTTPITVYIESPEQNLPVEEMVESSSPTSTFETDLSNEKIFDDETLDLSGGVKLPPAASKPLTSDIVIGQRWDMSCRKQWDGKLIVEKLKSGVIPIGQENLEEIHRVISKMVSSIASSKPESGADPSWATEDFTWEMELTPAPTPEPVIYPASKLKLKTFNLDQCVMMMEAPPWMTDSKYLTITLGHFGNDWRIESIEQCSPNEWNHK